MKTNVLIVKAQSEPMQGIEHPRPNQIYRNPRIYLEERELHSLDPDDIRVEMLYTGICGTDIHVVAKNPQTGYIKTSAPVNIPDEGRVIGHEGVGRILAAGSNVTYLHAGMYVTFESINVCNVCNVCRRGKFNQCRNAKLLGLEEDGLLGTVVDISAKLAHDVTDLIKSETDLIAAACIEPAGVAYVACENAHINGGDVVAIFGAGPIGIFSAILSKLVFGASEVHIIEPIAYRRDFARTWADKVYTSEEFFGSCEGNVDVVIESSGYTENVTKIIPKVNANGHVILLARSGESLKVQDVDHMITNEITIGGSRGHLCGAFSKILNLYRTQRIKLHDIVTSVVYGLDAAKDMLENSDILFSENCKVVVRLTDHNREQEI